MADATSEPHDPLPTGERRRLWGCLFTSVTVVLLAIWLGYKIRDAREAARSSQCRGHFAQLQLAFHNYHDTYGCFPQAYIADEHGTPLHSWRVLILPFIDQVQLYEQYRFDEPWNSPHNSGLANPPHFNMFHCPSGPNMDGSVLTDYVVIVGDGTPFPGDDVTTFDDFADGMENTILLVEIANSDIHWMEPRDLDAATMSYTLNDPARPSISSPHPWGPAVVFADRISSYRLQPSIRPETLRALTTIAGGEPVTKDDLIQRDPEIGGAILGE